MSSISSVTVTVPATTANLGPGFDCIGVALTLYNHFKFTRLSADTPLEEDRALRIAVKGLDAKRVQTDRSNLVYQTFVNFYQHIGHAPPPVQIDIELEIPLARGLGSSATAIAAGLVGANLLAGSPLTQKQLIQQAIAIEGHPDNIVPALLGGCRLAASVAADWEICEIPWHPQLVPVVAIPDFELSTSESRRVLPPEYSRADAIFNIGHLGLLVRAIETGRGDWLRAAMQDRIHQPYRQALIPGYEPVRAAALSAGAWEMAISGAGPTLLAIAPAASAPSVVTAMTEAWKQQGVSAEVRSLAIDTQGTRSASVSHIL